MKVKRVNYKDKMVIDYQTEKDFQRLYCSDFPEPEFLSAMNKCRQVLIDHMELKEVPAERIEINAFELKHEVGEEKEYILGGLLKSTAEIPRPFSRHRSSQGLPVAISTLRNMENSCRFAISEKQRQR